MKRLLLIGLFLSVACAPKDPLASVRRDFPGAADYLAWKGYVLVRFPAVDSTGAQPAVLLQREGREFRVLGENEEGFRSMRDVMTYIPEMDESGVAAFGLH